MFLILLALLTFLSFLSSQGAFTGWWLDLLKSIFGWGVFAAPLGLGAIGLWLILRRFEDKPFHIEPEVVVGIVLAFLAALASMHLLAGVLYDDALDALVDQGRGGGYLGLLLANLLLDAVGGWGAVVVLIALWITALIFILGVSVVELAQFFGRVWAWMRGRAPLRGAPSPQPELIINAPTNHTREATSPARTEPETAPSQTRRPVR